MDDETEKEVEKAYQKGLDDAWSFAGHLVGVSKDVTDSVYVSMNGGKGLPVAVEMSYEEAKKLYDQYFEQKEKVGITIGSVVTFDGDIRAIVMDYDFETKDAWIYTENGCIEIAKLTELKATGEHSASVQNMLRQIQEGGK